MVCGWPPGEPAIVNKDSCAILQTHLPWKFLHHFQVAYPSFQTGSPFGFSLRRSLNLLAKLGYSGMMSVLLQGHERIDQRSIAMHRVIAMKILAEPELLAIAHENIARAIAASNRSSHYAKTWSDILTKSLFEIAQLLEEDSETMRALRQATPFAGILTPAERWAIYDEFKSATVK